MSRPRSNNRIAGAFPGGGEDHYLAEKTASKSRNRWIYSIQKFIGPIYTAVNQCIEQCSPNKQVQLCLLGILLLCVSCQVPDRPERAHADPGLGQQRCGGSDRCLQLAKGVPRGG